MILKKLSSENSKIIIDFALFNYDNIICDYYGVEKSYLNQLALLIHRYTQHDIKYIEPPTSRKLLRLLILT